MRIEPTDKQQPFIAAQLALKGKRRYDSIGNFIVQGDGIELTIEPTGRFHLRRDGHHSLTGDQPGEMLTALSAWLPATEEQPAGAELAGLSQARYVELRRAGWAPGMPIPL